MSFLSPLKDLKSHWLHGNPGLSSSSSISSSWFSVSLKKILVLKDFYRFNIVINNENNKISRERTGFIKWKKS